jgi:nicotinate-nucleotide adenylyltransferase
VLYIPAWRQPFKTHLDAAPGAHRFAMAALAVRDYDMLYVSPIELDRGGISYSVDTLDELHRHYPGAAFDWIIGDDNVAELDRWKDPERLFQLARFVVLSRQPRTDDRQPTTATLLFAHNPTVPISSTEIRRRVRAGEPIDAFVDPLVSRYIHHYGLYKEGQP